MDQPLEATPRIEESSLEAMRNQRTQKLFILLEDDPGSGRVKVVNPNGEVLSVSLVIFENEPVLVSAAEYPELFTPEQIRAYATHQRESQRPSVRQANAFAASGSVASSSRRASAEPRPRRKSSRREGLRTQVLPVSGRISTEWVSPSLSFYRHKIEPLHARDSFCIAVEGEGRYVMTKLEFQENFNDVVISASYRSNGLYSYAQTPDKALKFLRK